MVFLDHDQLKMTQTTNQLNPPSVTDTAESHSNVFTGTATIE